MGPKPYRWTVDVEYDWGGRRRNYGALVECLPFILDLFKRNGIKALFFISTELLMKDPYYSPLTAMDLKKIIDDGHQIGSHGHRHKDWKHSNAAYADCGGSMAILYDICGIKPQDCEYRAPKFSSLSRSIYSNPKNHVSLLKHLWFGQKIKPETIIYLHPFDLYKWNELDRPPNIFCRFWYSRHKEARKLLSTLVNRYK